MKLRRIIDVAVAAFGLVAVSVALPQPASATPGYPIKYENAVLNCGYTSCSWYLSRAATITLDDQINKADVDLATDGALAALCSAASLVGTGKACSLYAAAYKYNLAKSLEQAVDAKECLQIKYYVNPLLPGDQITVYTHSGNKKFCIDGVFPDAVATPRLKPIG